MIIVPAGNKNVSWSPEEKLTKTASSGSAKETQDSVYEAAKKFMATASDSDICVKCNNPSNICECICEDEKVKEVMEEGAIVEVETEESEKKEEESRTEIKDAVEKIEEAVSELKDSVQKSDAAEEEEVEIEICDDEDKKEEVEEVEIEVEDDDKKELDIPGKDTSESEIIVESDDKEEEPKMDKSAATEEEFCRFAKLSPENKKKLSNYWVNMLNYPKDYVALMVKDYEK